MSGHRIATKPTQCIGDRCYH